MQQLHATRCSGVEAVRLVEGEAVRRLVARADGTAVGTLGSAGLDRAVLAQVREVIEEDDIRVEEVQTEEAQVQVFVQALQPRPTVYLFGGGHVGLALARLVPTVGMRLVVIDDRPEFCSRERFPMAAERHVRPFASAFDGLPIDELSYVVVMTRGHRWDREVVAQALRTRAGYIGMIGSRRKIALIWESLGEEGFTEADLARVRAPIGLDIGGDAPGEIAISVMAELIQVRHGGEAARGGGKRSGK
jgi:xanthine dehydrogenase accessory factor